MRPSTEPQPPPENRWRYANLSLLAPLVLFVTLIVAVEITLQQERLRAESAALQALGESAHQVRTLIEHELNSTLQLATGIEAYIQSKDGKVQPQELAPWLSHLQDHSPHIRDIALAPGNRVEFIYPIKGNEKALGLYYPEDAAQWPLVKKAMETHSTLLAGPLTLRQGGTGLLYRVPVYLSNDAYWGLITTVLDFDEIYRGIHQRALDAGIKIAVEDLDEQNTLLFGEHTATPSYQLTLNPPGRHWRMIASPRNYQPSHSLAARLTGWTVSFATALLLYYLLRTLARQQATTLALAESKYRFAQVFNSAPQGIAVIASTGELLDVNASLRNSLGYSAKELAQRNFFDLVAPGHREQLQEVMSQTGDANLAERQYESLLIHHNGQPINVILGLAPALAKTHAGDWHAGDWIVQMIDISPRVAFEQLLRHEADYNQAILNAVADGIMIVDSQGVIHSANPACGRIFSGERTQMPGKFIGHFVHTKIASNIIRYFADHTDSNNRNLSHSHELQGIKFDGTAFSVELQLSSIQRNHEHLFIVVVRDISERKRLERMKNEFISTVSHELRTPLTAVLGAIRLLANGALDDAKDKAHKLIGIADQNGKKLARLIDDLLDMDKSIAGKMHFEFETLALYPLVTEAIEQNSAYSAQHKVKIELIADDTPLYVTVDSHRLQQVLANLLSNAAKFSPENSTVLVTISHTTKRVRIEIRDSGIGIPKHLQENLFQQFYQVDSSNTRQKGGTGLGLAIAKQLVEAMQGNIGVESEEYRGSCFFIELPLAEKTVMQNG